MTDSVMANLNVTRPKVGIRHEADRIEPMISAPLTGDINERLDQMWSVLNEVCWRLKHVEELCPYHDQIVELKGIAEKVHKLELHMAKWTAIGALVGSLGGGIMALALAKGLGL